FAIIFDGILNRDPVPPAVLNPEAGERLNDIILKLTEKDRSLRYQSAAELEADLKRLRRDRITGSISRASGQPVVPQSKAAPSGKKWWMRVGIPAFGLAGIAPAALVFHPFRTAPALPVELATPRSDAPREAAPPPVNPVSAAVPENKPADKAPDA